VAYHRLEMKMTGGSMRAARIIGEGMSYYHGISRVIERNFVLSDDEKERFRILLRKTATFSGITVMTHSILDNHDR